MASAGLIAAHGHGDKVPLVVHREQVSVKVVGKPEPGAGHYAVAQLEEEPAGIDLQSVADNGVANGDVTPLINDDTRVAAAVGIALDPGINGQVARSRIDSRVA